MVIEIQIMYFNIHLRAHNARSLLVHFCWLPFMHDLESFFWVLFWICIHYDGSNGERVVPEFDKWNYVDTEELAKLKLGTVAKETFFLRTVTDNFTPYYQPLIPWVNRLRREVFPMDKPCEKSEDPKLYSRMKGILREARKNPKVSEDRELSGSL